MLASTGGRWPTLAAWTKNNTCGPCVLIQNFFGNNPKKKIDIMQKFQFNHHLFFSVTCYYFPFLLCGCGPYQPNYLYTVLSTWTSHWSCQDIQ